MSGRPQMLGILSEPVHDRDATPSPALSLALPNMPWARADAPSIQCGLLKAVATQAGHRCDVHYFNVELAAKLGP